VYFLAAIFFSAVLVVAILSITLSEDITYLSLYTVILILITPILFGIGSYILGVIQTISDKTNGITAVLTVLPVIRGRIFLARLIIGILIIMTLLGPLAVIGAILWELLGPPDWLFHNWLADTFMGLSLASLVCYCLGLVAARRAETFTSALRALPLVPILMLLIVIKGFGWPLLAVLLPLLAVLLLRCWKTDSNRFITITSTGFTVLVLLAIPLYFCRNICDGLLVTKMDASAKVSPSGLLPMQIENDPNVVDYSEVIGRMNLDCRQRNCAVHKLLDSCHLFSTRYYKASHNLLKNSGIMEYFKSRNRGEWYKYPLSSHPLNWYALSTFGPPIQNIHLDIKKGQLICRFIITDMKDNRWRPKDVTKIYVGPKGVSTVPNSNLGYFKSPIIHFFSSNVQPKSTYQCLVYDKHSRCFFDINFENKTIRKGPQIQDSSIHPVEVGLLPQSGHNATVGFNLPSTKDYKYRSPSHVPKAIVYLPIVDVTGRIGLLDLRTLNLISSPSHLPKPQTIFGQASSKPRHLLDYGIDVIWLIPSKTLWSTRLIADKIKGGYMGYITTSVSRQGFWTSVAVFDKDGKKIKSADSESTFFNVPGGPALAITKYIFESLHPPVLTLASFFTAYSFDARSTHRALFLMPNSFVAMARDYQGNIFYMFLLVLLLMLPGILFAALLGWLIVRDAAMIGLSHKARRLWLAGTLVFGLPAYITYRLTRPKVTLVTCANCGKPRRPVSGICHRCGSKWDVPELTPPEWRVLNGVE
jgi:hypothetical protein